MPFHLDGLQLADPAVILLIDTFQEPALDDNGCEPLVIGYGCEIPDTQVNHQCPVIFRKLSGLNVQFLLSVIGHDLNPVEVKPWHEPDQDDFIPGMGHLSQWKPYTGPRNDQLPVFKPAPCVIGGSGAVSGLLFVTRDVGLFSLSL